jgi:hypothetical protein
MFLLGKLFSNDAISTSTGVPRGMNISATLSEIYMRKFDRWVREYNGVYYYARFVDDIIIFTNSLPNALSLIQDMTLKLSELTEGLMLNERKTQLFDGKTLNRLKVTDGKPFCGDNALEYLGYKFLKDKVTTEAQKCKHCGTETKKGKEIYKLKISIADKKVKKIKTRITRSFADYLKTNDFSLLNDRTSFLTGNYSIKKRNNDDSDLRAGIFFNYSQLSDFTVLDELNLYYRKTLFAKNGAFGTKLHSKLSSVQKEKLKKYCFRSGFVKKTYNAFNYARMSEIIKCW